MHKEQGVDSNVESQALSSYKNKEIEENAKDNGYKAANLQELRLLTKGFKETPEHKKLVELYGEIEIEVPAFQPIGSSVIISHLDQHARNWRDLWDKFTTTFEGQKDQNTLGEASIKCLENLQTVIVDCFSKNLVSEELYGQFLQDNAIKPDDLLMVRSTGIHEDKADMANPGGNESLPCRATREEISKALGQVVASYVGVKSLSQRLISDTKASILEFPVMPGLIQKMVYENDKQMVSSGISYTKDGSTTTNVTYGHGQGIADSTIRGDKVFFSKAGIEYYTSNPKPERLKTTIDVAGKEAEVRLVPVKNDKDAKFNRAIDQRASIYLDAFCRYTEQQYGQEVDIEFINAFNKGTQKYSALYPVQVRIIPQGKTRGEPSAISPAFLAENQHKLNIIDGQKVLTPHVDRAAVITNSNQVIIDSNGEGALKQYNALGKDSGIKVVVVQDEKDGEFSHAVGFFNSQSVVVIQVKDINIVKELLAKNPGQPLIIDSQRSKIYQLPNELFPPNRVGDIEEALYEAEPPILETGIFASPDKDSIISSSHPLPQPQEKLDKPVAIDPLQEALGVLIAKAQSGDSYSLNQVLAVAHAVISYGIIESQNQLEREKVDPQILRKNIERLSTPQMGQDNKECRAALSRNLRAVRDSYNDGVISQELFIQTMIVGVNLHDLLNKMSLLTAEGLTKERYKEKSNKNYLEYFTILEKFKGLIIKPGESLMTSIHTDIYRGQAEKLIKESLANDRQYKLPQDLLIIKTSLTISDEERRDVLIKSLAIGAYLNKEQQKQWEQFSAHICARGTAEHIMKLNNLLDQLDFYNAHEQWLKNIFIQENIPTAPLATINKLDKDFQDIITRGSLKKIDQATNVINRLEGQISEWSNPNKFDALYKNLQKNLTEINQNLEWKKEATHLEQILILPQGRKLLNIIDKSIKSLGNSSLYPADLQDQKGNNLQASRVKEMLIPFSNFVNIWIENAAFKGTAGINAKNKLTASQKFMQNKDSIILTKDELLPSAGFAVNRATIDISGGRPKPSTLADQQTLDHQDGEVAFARLYKALGINDIIISRCPPLVKSLSDKFDKELIGENNKKIYPSTTGELKDGTVIINKNLPLRTHAATAAIKYTPKTDVTSVQFHIFGSNDDHYYRWDHVVLDSYLDLSDARCNFITLPYFDTKKEIVDFEVKVDSEDQAKIVIQVINKSLVTSFNPADHDYILNLYKNRLEKLEKLSIEKPELGPALDRLYFMPKVPIIYSEFKEIRKNNPVKAFFILNNYLNIIKSHKTEDVIPFEKLMAIYDQDEEEGEFLAKNGAKINELRKHGFITTFQEFKELYKKDQETAELILSWDIAGSKALSEIGLTPQKLMEICGKDKKGANFLAKNCNQIFWLNQEGVSWQKVLKIYKQDKEKGEFLVKYDHQIKELARAYGFIITLQKARTLYKEDQEKAELILRFDISRKDNLSAFGLTPQTLMAIYKQDKKIAKFLGQNLPEITELHMGGLTLKKLIEIYTIDQETAELLVKNSFEILDLMRTLGITTQKFIEKYDPHLVKFILSDATHCVALKDICESSEFTLQDLLQSNLGQIQQLLNAEITPENFKKSLIKNATQKFDGVVISDSTAMNIDVDLPTLHKAIEQGNVEGADLLFKKLADNGISLADSRLNKITEGKTSTLLDMALDTSCDTIKVIETLLSYPTGRSLLTKKDLDGFTPLEKARRRGNMALVAVLEDAYIEVVKEQLVKYFQKQLEDKTSLTSSDTKAMINKVEEILSPLSLNANNKDIIQIAGPMVRKYVEIAGRNLDWQQKLRKIIDTIKEYLPTTYSSPQTRKIKNILKDKAVIAQLKTLNDHQFKIDPKKISKTTVGSKQSINSRKNKEL